MLKHLLLAWIRDTHSHLSDPGKKENLLPLHAAEYIKAVGSEEALKDLQQLVDSFDTITRLVEKGLSTEKLLNTLSASGRGAKSSEAITVQSPLSLSADERRSMEEHFVSLFPNTVVSFVVEPALLGGIRIFKDGKMIDGSWRGKIHSALR